MCPSGQADPCGGVNLIMCPSDQADPAAMLVLRFYWGLSSNKLTESNTGTHVPGSGAVAVLILSLSLSLSVG